jgi:predicted HAD superfamily Cof-like phosphohydrolase
VEPEIDSTEINSTEIDSTEAAVATGSSRARHQVGDFHRAYGLPIRDEPTAAVGPDQVGLRQALIEEEVRELSDAASAGDLVGVADALADIVYVAYGTAHVYGIDLDAVLDEVHASNMTKLGADGRPVRRADGKVLKGPAYRPPDISAVLGRRATTVDGVTLD